MGKVPFTISHASCTAAPPTRHDLPRGSAALRDPVTRRGHAAPLDLPSSPCLVRSAGSFHQRLPPSNDLRQIRLRAPGKCMSASRASARLYAVKIHTMRASPAHSSDDLIRERFIPTVSAGYAFAFTS